MKRITTPVVCREVLTDHPILVVSHADGDLGVIYREDGRRLGLAVQSEMWWDVHVFPLKEDPKAYAEVLKAYALHCGADPDAARVLRRFTQVTDEEFIRMTTKTMADRKKAVETNAGKKGTAKTAEAKAPKRATQTPEEKEAKKAANLAKLRELNEAKKAKRAAEGPKERKPSAASRFKELIMAGKMTDDNIFADVQKEFGLDDSKRSYVAWYRNQLRKDGQNPPEARAK
jgi:hypothetical protein